MCIDCKNGTPEFYPDKCGLNCPKDILNNCEAFKEMFFENIRALAMRQERIGRKMARRIISGLWKEEGYYMLQKADIIQVGDIWFKPETKEGPWVEVKEESPEVGQLYDPETMDLIRRKI